MLLLEDIDTVLQISISCFLEDMDPRFKIFKNSNKDLHHFSAPICSNIFTTSAFRFWNSQNISLEICLFFLAYLRCPGDSKD